jgi:hypothetical protein
MLGNTTTTNTGVVWQFTICGAGALTPANPATVATSSGTAVAMSTMDSDLFVLGATPAGDHVDYYSMNSTGLLTAVNTTAVPGGDQPMAIGVLQYIP